MNTEDIALFHRIVETGSLAAASQKLNLPKSTLSRRLTGLEERVGARLFHRHGRSIQLTMSGRQFYERSKNILNDLDQVLLEIVDEETELKGRLKVLIAQGPKYEDFFVRVFEFMDMHPKVEIELITKVEAVDVIVEQFDVAILTDTMFTNTDVVAKPFFTETLRYYATPEYISKFGEPREFCDLQSHNVALFKYALPVLQKKTLLPNNQWQEVRSRFTSNDVNALSAAVMTSKVIAMLPERTHQFIVKQGQLKPLFALKPAIELEVFLVFPSRNYTSIVTQKFIDYLYKSVD